MSQNTPHFPTRTSLLSFVSFILSTRPQGGAKAQRTEEIQYMVYEYGKLKDSRDDLTSKKKSKRTSVQTSEWWFHSANRNTS